MFCCLLRYSAAPGTSDAAVLETVARACSPRVERLRDDLIVFDASGLSRVIGPPPIIAAEIQRLAAMHQITVRIALAGSSIAARLLAHAHPGVTISAPGEDARRLSELPIEVLVHLPELAEIDTAILRPPPPIARGARGFGAAGYRMAPGPQQPERSESSLIGLIATLDRWGLRTLGDIARLSRADLHTRFGAMGVRLHQTVCGEDTTPLSPDGEAPRFVAGADLDWPIEGLEPLSFVLARLCDTLSTTLERADRGAVAIKLTLGLVTRGRTHVRTLNVPAPMRDARMLRTLMLLDLESHPPDAGVDRVEIEVDVTPGRIVQGSLLTRPLPSAENVATLVARLSALMGESRVGAPVLPDTYDERKVEMGKFLPTLLNNSWPASVRSSLLTSDFCLLPCLRRFRLPIPVRVTVEHGLPARVLISTRADVAAGAVRTCAGPYRTSGRWWMGDGSAWQRDEWDVALADAALYRLSHDHVTKQWQIEGVID